MKYYAVIDTNVIVSAMLKWNSVPGNIVEFSFNGLIVPVFNDEIIKEYRDVLLRPKFHLSEQIVNDVLDAITENGVYINGEKIDVELPDPKDRVFYEVVMEKRREEDAYLVTGNLKHFPVKTFIVTPREMLDIILSDAEE